MQYIREGDRIETGEFVYTYNSAPEGNGFIYIPLVVERVTDSGWLVLRGVTPGLARFSPEDTYYAYVAKHTSFYSTRGTYMPIVRLPADVTHEQSVACALELAEAARVKREARLREESEIKARRAAEEARQLRLAMEANRNAVLEHVAYETVYAVKCFNRRGDRVLVLASIEYEAEWSEWSVTLASHNADSNRNGRGFSQSLQPVRVAAKSRDEMLQSIYEQCVRYAWFM